MPSIGKRIRGLRKDREYTQELLAELADVSTITVIKWESDKKKPNSENIHKLSKIFGVSMNYIQDGELIKDDWR